MVCERPISPGLKGNQGCTKDVLRIYERCSMNFIQNDTIVYQAFSPLKQCFFIRNQRFFYLLEITFPWVPHMEKAYVYDFQQVTFVKNTKIFHEVSDCPLKKMS